MELQTSPCDEDDNATERVYKRLWLSNNNLNGTIPEETFTLLTNLESINLFNSSSLQGTLSSRIQSLTNLTLLSLVMTGVSGTIPSTLGVLSSLQIVYFEKFSDKRGRMFEGSIPSELGQLTNLVQLTIGSSSLTGRVPTELGNLSLLKFLMLQNNHLTGPIPTELGHTQ